MAQSSKQLDRLKIAVWGVGDHARRNILPAITASLGTSLAGITTRDAECLETQSDKWGCKAWAYPDEMLSDNNIDVVYIATPTGLHYDHAKRCLESGRGVLSEKPLCEHLDQAFELADIARQKKLLFSVACGPIYHRQFRQMQDLLKSGDIGRIQHISARFGFPHLDPANIRYDPSLGGGAFLDIAFYLLFMSELLVSSPLETVESAELEQERPFEVDTSGTARLLFSNGVTADAEWGYGMDYINELEVIGETGSLFARPAFSKPAHIPAYIDITRDNQVRRLDIEVDNQFVSMLDEFVRAANDDDLKTRLLGRALRTQTLLEEVRRAAKLQ